MDIQDSNVDFTQTPWSLVDALRSDSEDSRRQALDQLSTTYWPAVYSFLRRRGNDRDKAAELTQGFFSDVVLTRNLFDHADPDRARLRTLILKALQNFLVDQHRRKVSRGEQNRVSLDHAAAIEQDLSRHGSEDPTTVYHKQWAGALLLEALRRCETHYEDGENGNWPAFMARVIHPTIHGSEPPSSRELAEKYGFDNAAAVNNAVHAVRKRMLVVLKQVVAETAGEDIAEEEYKHILDLLS